MGDFSRWNSVAGFVASCIVIIGFVYSLLRNEGAFWKFVGRSIQRMTVGLFYALESLFSAFAEWWNSWGRRFTTVLVIVGVLSGGIFYIVTRANLIGQISTSLRPQAQTYSTHTPGSRCDKGTGQWKEDKQLLLTCLTNQVGLTYTGDGSDFYELFFGGSDATHHLFTTAYSVHITVTFPDSSDAYVGVGVHGIANKGTCGQMGWIQPSDAAWVLYRYNIDGGVDATLDTGSMTATGSTYTLDIAVRGTLITLLVNGIFATSLTDNTFQTTSYACIGVGGSQNDTVTISDFEFTPNS